MSPQRELEIDKATLAFAVLTSTATPEVADAITSRIESVNTREDFDYLMAVLRVDVGDE